MWYVIYVTVFTTTSCLTFLQVHQTSWYSKQCNNIILLSPFNITQNNSQVWPRTDSLVFSDLFGINALYSWQKIVFVYVEKVEYGVWYVVCVILYIIQCVMHALKHKKWNFDLDHICFVQAFEVSDGGRCAVCVVFLVERLLPSSDRSAR